MHKLYFNAHQLAQLWLARNELHQDELACVDQSNRIKIIPESKLCIFSFIEMVDSFHYEINNPNSRTLINEVGGGFGAISITQYGLPENLSLTDVTLNPFPDNEDCYLCVNKQGLFFIARKISS